MVQFNVAGKEINVKIVYYGPALSGKTTNLQMVHKLMASDNRGRLMSLDTKDDRTLFFDLLPAQFKTKSGYKVQLKVFTVPGQVIHNSTRLQFRSDGYHDQLALADRTLSEIRTAMEAAGTWDSSTVLVTSDHPSRGATRAAGLEDDEVPFLLKLAGHHDGLRYETVFSAATGHALVGALLAGEIGTPEETAAWLDAHAIAPDPGQANLAAEGG